MAATAAVAAAAIKMQDDLDHQGYTYLVDKLHDSGAGISSDGLQQQGRE